MPNHLSHETSPYLLQHANNPVDWYPRSEEAFTLAREQDKPVFLSIGYSTCHWCHVMARESFEDTEIAALLNRHFISVKVDKEERPDIDSVYMRVCLAFMGSGGWPTSIFMTADQKPFFAGTYFPKVSRGGMYGLRELLTVIAEQWKTNRSALLDQAERLLRALQDAGRPENAKADDLPEKASGMRIQLQHVAKNLSPVEQVLCNKAKKRGAKKKPMDTLKMYSRDFVLRRQAAIRNNRDEAKSKQEDGKKLTEDEEAVAASKLRMEDQEEIRILTDEEIARQRNVAYNGYFLEFKSRGGKSVRSWPYPLKKAKFFIFAMNVGLRKEELMALKYSDVDFDKKRITIRSNPQ